MSRVLGIELRRSAAPGTALVLLAIGVVLLFFAEGIMFADGWMQLAMTQRLFLVLLWPLALAAGAWQARREHRSNVGELFAGTPLPRVTRALPTLGAMAVAVVAGYVLMGVAGGLWIIGTARYLPMAAFAVTAVGALALVAAVWLGLALGRFLPSPATAPVLGIAGLGMLLFLPRATRPRGWLAVVLSPSDQMNMPDAFTTVPGRVSLAQAGWMIGLALAAAVLLGSGGRRGRIAALAPLVLGAGLAVSVVPHQNRVVWDAIDPVARQLVCTPDTPRVCVSRAHSGLLPEVVPQARAGLAALAPLPAAPREVHEDTTTYPRDGLPVWREDVVLLDVVAARNGHLAGASDAAQVVTQAFAGPADCEEPADAADMLAAASWLTGRRPAAPDPSSEPTAEGYDAATVADAVQRWQALRRLPAGEARERVSALHRAAVTCSARPGLLTGRTS